jgi:hypothetical protein
MGAPAEPLMEPFQILIQTGLEFLDARALPRKLQVLAWVYLVHQRVDLPLPTFGDQMIG